MKYKVWDCKIIVPEDAELPPGFDAPPRSAAIRAVLDAGIDVICCSSGWGGSLTKEEEAIDKIQLDPYPEVYIAGTMDTDDTKH